MKRWSGQLFPIILLALLAGLTFWLQRTVEHEEPRRDGKLRHDPDATAENFVVHRFDEDGRLKFRLSGPLLVHYPDDDTSEVKSPRLIHYRPDMPQVTLTGDNAKALAKGETIYLWDNVVITRAASAERPEMVARMQDLTAHPDAGTAFTNGPIRVTEGQSWMSGVGAQLDNNAATLRLESQVRGQLFPRQKAQP